MAEDDQLSLLPNAALPAVTRPLWFGKATRQSITPAEVQEAAEQIASEPNYAKNGWTPETLAVYFKERTAAHSNTILRRRPARPKRTVGWHNPHKWRR